MFTRRVEAGSAEARRAVANGAHGSRFGWEGQSRSSDRGPEQRVRSLGDAAVKMCIFIASALFRKHLVLAQQRCPHSAAVDPDIVPFSSIRSACA